MKDTQSLFRDGPFVDFRTLSAEQQMNIIGKNHDTLRAAAESGDPDQMKQALVAEEKFKKGMTRKLVGFTLGCLAVAAAGLKLGEITLFLSGVVVLPVSVLLSTTFFITENLFHKKLKNIVNKNINHKPQGPTPDNSLGAKAERTAALEKTAQQTPGTEQKARVTQENLTANERPMGGRGIVAKPYVIG